MTSAGTRGGWPRRAWVEIPPEEGWEPVAGPWGRAGCPGWGRLPASFPPSIRPSVRPSPPGSTGQLPARRLCPGEPPSPHQRVPRAMALVPGVQRGAGARPLGPRPLLGLPERQGLRSACPSSLCGGRPAAQQFVRPARGATRAPARVLLRFSPGTEIRPSVCR